MNTNTRKWSVVAGCFLLYFMVMGLVSNCYSQYIIPITTEFGFSRGSYSISQSLMAFASMIISYFGWKIYEKFGTINVIRVALYTIVAMHFLASVSSKLYMFYIVYFIMGACQSLTTTIPSALLIKEWFTEKSNTAIGYAAVGSGVGGTVLNMLCAYLIENVGWRMTYRYLGILAAVVYAIPAFVLLKRNPEAIAKEAADMSKKEKKTAKTESALTKELLIFVFIYMSFCLAGNMCMNTINPHLRDLGYSTTFAAGMVSAAMAVLGAGKFCYGILLDKFGLRKCLTMTIASEIITMLAMIFYFGHICILPYMIGVFLGNPFGTVAIGAVADFLAKSDNKAQVMSTVSAFGGAAGMAASLLTGYAYDLAGSYRPAYAIVTLYLCIALLFINKLFKKEGIQ